MAYNGKYVISSLSGVRIPVSNLPIGIEFDFSSVVSKIMTVLDETDLFKEIKHKGAGIQFDIVQVLWNIKNRNSELLNILLDKSGLEFINPAEFLITSTIEFTTRMGELVPLVSNDNRKMFTVLNEYRYIIPYKFNMNTEEILQSRKILNVQTELFGMSIPKLMSKLSDSGLERINVEIMEMDTDWYFSQTPIISTQQKSKNNKYYAGKVPVFNHDWQLNGEFEPRIILHPNILPLTMRYHKPQGESKWNPTLVPTLELLKS